MPRFVVLSPASEGLAGAYDVRVGPLSFVATAGPLGETLGDGLETVGAALTPAEARPRPIKLELPIRGARDEPDLRDAGLRLRRQARQLLDNARWRTQGLYLFVRFDHELSGWLLIGGGTIDETDPGVSFGEFDLELEDVYLVGRPGTHRGGRRLDLGDRRGGLRPRDTRRTLYSTDFASHALPAEPVVIPGDVVAFTRTGNQPVGSSTPGALINARRLWRTVAGADGEVITYLPDPALVEVMPDGFAQIDDVGAVRVWDLSRASSYPPDPSLYGAERDIAPDLFYGWERVLGDTLDPTTPLAVENGVCRLVWLGPAATEGLAVELWDAGLGYYRRAARVLHSLNVGELRVIEVTPERAVLEARAGELAMRAILQRGWYGPRLESYNDGGGTARLEYAPYPAAAPVVAALTPSWVQSITANGYQVRWAQSSSAEVRDTTPTVISGTAATYRRARTVVGQLCGPAGPAAAELASLSLVDAQSTPVLVARR
jgi:hypothetical protein